MKPRTTRQEYVPRRTRRHITYHEAELIRDLREYHQITVVRLAEKFDLSETAIGAILKYRTYLTP